MIAVAKLLTQYARLIVELNGAQVLAAQVVQISYVVVGFRYQKRKPVFLTMLARKLILAA